MHTHIIYVILFLVFVIHINPPSIKHHGGSIPDIWMADMLCRMICAILSWNAVVLCTQFCSDHCINIEVRVRRNFHRIWIAMEKLLWNGAQQNKANLRDLIVATGLVILLKLDSNRRFFSLCDLDIWWTTLKNNRASLLYYIKLCASFQIHRWIQTGVAVHKPSIQVKIADFFVPCDLEIWCMTLKKNRAPLLCYVKLCTSFQSHW